LGFLVAVWKWSAAAAAVVDRERFAAGSRYAVDQKHNVVAPDHIAPEAVEAVEAEKDEMGWLKESCRLMRHSHAHHLASWSLVVFRYQQR
jgi:hypothetical protein